MALVYNTCMKSMSMYENQTDLRSFIEGWQMRFGLWFTSFTGFVIITFGIIIYFKHPEYYDPMWVRWIVAGYLILGGWLYGRKGMKQFMRFVWVSIGVFPLWSLWVLWVNDIPPRYLMTVYLVLLGYCTIMPKANFLTWWAIGYSAVVVGLILIHPSPITPWSDIAPTFLFSGIVVYSLCYALILAKDAFLKSQSDLAQKLDIERKLNQELQETQSELTKVLKVKSEFLSTVSHELRTPMHAVIGLSDILLTENPRNDQLETLQTLQQSSRVMMSLVNNILDFSKIEAGAMELESIDFNLSQMIRSVVESFQWQVRKKEIHLQVEGISLLATSGTSANTWVKGDPTRLTQILNNLLSNAIKFTPVQGAVHLSVNGEGTTWRFEVRDTGIGMSPQEMSRILEPFTQADNSTTRKFGGTGLGLTICVKLLELMGSKLAIQSQKDQGSQFSFVLDLAQGQILGGNKDLQEISAEVLAGKRVLLVEDNPVNVKVATKILSRWGLQIDVAYHGGEALEWIQKSAPYDIILLDMHMPVMDGIETLQILRSLPQQSKAQIPVLVLTASVTGASLSKLEGISYQGFLSKPFKPNDLKAQLSMVMSGV